MNRTVKEVINPTGSRMIGKVISELLIVTISQWMRTVCWLKANSIVIGLMKIVSVHMRVVKAFDELF